MAGKVTSVAPGQVPAVIIQMPQAPEQQQQGPASAQGDDSWFDCDCITSLVGRVAQYWREIPIVAATVYLIICAVEALFSGALFSALGLAFCATVLLFALDSIGAQRLVQQLQSANAELRSQVDRVHSVAGRFETVLPGFQEEIQKLAHENTNLATTREAGDLLATRFEQIAGRIEAMMAQPAYQRLLDSVSALEQQKGHLEGAIGALQRQVVQQQAATDSLTAASAVASGVLTSAASHIATHELPLAALMGRGALFPSQQRTSAGIVT
ncbi:MAG: hypothetical protein HYX48_02780 [Chlamydiales bacterium]|nr:hypothetical protein [Chlamydiales bacterium]